MSEKLTEGEVMAAIYTLLAVEKDFEQQEKGSDRHGCVKLANIVLLQAAAHLLLLNKILPEKMLEQLDNAAERLWIEVSTRNITKMIFEATDDKMGLIDNSIIEEVKRILDKASK